MTIELLNERIGSPHLEMLQVLKKYWGHNTSEELRRCINRKYAQEIGKLE